MGDSDMSEPSSSKGKRRRIEVENLTEEELLRILEDLDIEDCNFNSEGSYALVIMSCPLMKMSLFVFLNTYSYFLLVFIVDEANQINLTVDYIGISEGSTNIVDNSDIWNDFCMGMKQIDFQKAPGFLVPENASPYDYFRLFLDEKLLEDVVNKTNSYAETIFLSVGISEHSRITRWRNVTKNEFIELIVHSGTIKCNILKDYWKTH